MPAWRFPTQGRHYRRGRRWHQWRTAPGMTTPGFPSTPSKTSASISLTCRPWAGCAPAHMPPSPRPPVQRAQLQDVQGTGGKLPLPDELHSQAARTWLHGGQFDVSNPTFFNPFDPPSRPPTLPTPRGAPPMQTPQRYGLPHNFDSVLAGTAEGAAFPTKHYYFSPHEPRAVNPAEERDMLAEFRKALDHAHRRPARGHHRASTMTLSLIHI